MNRIREEMCRQMQRNTWTEEPPVGRQAGKSQIAGNLAPLSPSSLVRRLGHPIQASEPSGTTVPDRKNTIDNHAEDRQGLSRRLREVQNELRTAESRLALTERQLVISQEQMQVVETRAKNTAYAVMLFKDAILSGFFQPARATVDFAQVAPL